MKKHLTLSIHAILLLLMFVSCRRDEPTIYATDVIISPNAVSLFPGNTFRLTATIFPENATNKSLVWVSTHPSVASVSNGSVTGLETGTTHIIATTQDGSHADMATVTVGTFSCNLDTPEWGNSIGTVSFHTNQTWTITGNGISQIWSDAVTATACQKETFEGGIANNLNSDCRSNPDFPGDLFSWCAVVRFADVFCPYPWRIPTRQDFINLDIAMGGTGVQRTDTLFAVNYINRWGGALGGWCTSIGVFSNQDIAGNYWSQLESTTANGNLLSFTSGNNNPVATGAKGMGRSLRCVRGAGVVSSVPVMGVTLPATAAVTIGNTVSLVATVLPQIATNRNVTWSSSNTAIATVSNTGVITGVSGGIATITVTTQDGNHTATTTLSVPLANGCNLNALAFELGTQSFATTQTWTIPGTDGRPSQEWSDAVRMSGCDKTTYAGGSTGNFNADCRNATNGFDGHYFSWCMVMRFADVLCPGDWRVPTTEDFAILHQNLGYTLPFLGDWVSLIPNTYMGTEGSGSAAINRGGSWGGSRFTAWSGGLTSAASYYWSSTESSATTARRLAFDSGGVLPQGSDGKSNGFALRCVR